MVVSHVSPALRSPTAYKSPYSSKRGYRGRERREICYGRVTTLPAGIFDGAAGSIIEL